MANPGLTNPMCIHGKAVHERCLECEEGMKRGEHGGFVRAWEQAPSKELTHEERCERIREIEASFLHRGNMAVEIYRLQHVNGQIHESLKSMHKSRDDWMGECQRIEDRRSTHEPPDVIPEVEAVWDLVVRACQSAWPGEKRGYGQSPIELIIDLINERDEALRSAQRPPVTLGARIPPDISFREQQGDRSGRERMTHELQTMLDGISKRDQNAVSDISGMFGTSYPSIEQRIWLADGRAIDALAAVATLAKYIMKLEAAAEAAKE